ncbi:energy transducer TonB [Neptuniibacter sp. CAU 1671]|uniref:energy transducer TonB n=1 Tax=Neptuniibacter sp. CAU 1671 TaxID=3032593 RepID=UPI0023DACE2A|nr:energy transducer TonB [Neptuniibacter sp. CAU 1671]MDF2182378.1 energy transducer TonB [Neptuniibacter sp. CAU 1671]
MRTATQPVVSVADRFGFTLFFAAAFHALIVLGVGFTVDKPKPRTTIEVTLAQQPSETRPDKADFIAQADQQGSGDEQKKSLPSTRQTADFQDNQSQALAAQQAPQPTLDAQPSPDTLADARTSKDKNTTPARSGQQQVVTATQAKRSTSDQRSSPDKAAPQAAPGTATSLLARSLEIASLQADIKRQQELLARAPRVLRVTTAATQGTDYAAYMDNWRKEIERVGNINYPAEARRQKMYGSLRLLVAIRADGTVQELELLQSSGFPVLDDAALKIVRLAAPFPPFTVEMRKKYDTLEIIRTWKFEKKAYLD